VASQRFFNWALEGLDRLTARGHFVNPESGKDAVRLMEDLSSPISAFVRDCCLVGGRYEVTRDALWGAWKTWCEDDNRPPGTKAVFGRDLRAAVPTLKDARPREQSEQDEKTARVRTYQGIGLCRDYSGEDPGPPGPTTPHCATPVQVVQAILHCIPYTIYQSGTDSPLLQR
jgi:putative DNA primase/helicase